MKRIANIFICGVLVVFTGCSFLARKPVYTGPFLVPHEGPVPGIPEEAQYADHWIRSSSDPDKVILNPEEIEKFNAENPLNDSYIINILNLPKTIEGKNIRDKISAKARNLLKENLYVTADIPLETAERNRIVALMDTAGVPDIITLKFGVMLHREMGIEFPAAIPVMTEPGDNEFDYGVASTIDMGEPVALLHTSKDGLWSYVQTYGFTCWIHSSAVAFGDIETVRKLSDRSMPILAVTHRVSVFPSPEEDTAMGSIEMGSYLTLTTAGTNYLEVLVPARGIHNELVAKRGYIRRGSEISMGFLPYTLRNVYRQCFELFGRRYGWGGMYEERDCASYVMSVFRCFGFRLPRNSSKLIQASPCVIPLKEYDRDTRLEILSSSPEGITIIGYPGHVMIYLGSMNGTPYIIHSTWAWRSSVNAETDVTHRLARVTVSDLLLGDGSKKGALIDKVTQIAIFGNYILETR